MSYRIEYAPVNLDLSRERSQSLVLVFMTLTVFALFLFILHIYLPDFEIRLQRVLLPGDPEVTGEALETMAMNLKDGLPFSQSVAAFCNEIFHNASIR